MAEPGAALRATVVHFVRQASVRFHIAPPIVPQREIERAQRYHWPGNVRSLQNVVERALIVAHGGKLTFDLPQTGMPSRPVAASSAPIAPATVTPEKEWRIRERADVLAALRQTKFKVSGQGGAAELLGVNPGTLASRIKALGIDKRDYVAGPDAAKLG